MNAIRNIDEVRLPNIYILLNIYHILQLTKIVTWATKALSL